MTTAYLQRIRSFNRDVRLFLLAVALFGLCWDGMRAVLLNLYLLRLDFGPEFVGLLSSTGAIAFSATSLPAGAFGTRWGSRRMTIIGMLMMAGGATLLPLVELVPVEWQVAWLLTLTLPTHAGMSLYLVNGTPYLMGSVGIEERNHAFSVYMALAPLAAFAGALLGGVLPGLLTAVLDLPPQDPAAYRYPLFLAGLLLIPAVWALLSTHEVRTYGVSAPLAKAAPIPLVLIVLIAVVVGLRFGGRGVTSIFFNVYLDDGLGISTALIGVLTATGQLLSVPAALGAPLLAARWGNARVVFLGSLGMGLCILPLALIPNWTAAGLGFVTSSAFFAVTGGPIRVFSQELVAPRWRATMSAAFMAGAGVSFAAMVYAGGRIISNAGYEPLFLLAAGMVVASALVFWAYFRVPRGEQAHLEGQT